MAELRAAGGVGDAHRRGRVDPGPGLPGLHGRARGRRRPVVVRDGLRRPGVDRRGRDPARRRPPSPDPKAGYRARQAALPRRGRVVRVLGREHRTHQLPRAGPRPAPCLRPRRLARRRHLSGGRHRECRLLGVGPGGPRPGRGTVVAAADGVADNEPQTAGNPTVHPAGNHILLESAPANTCCWPISSRGASGSRRATGSKRARCWACAGARGTRPSRTSTSTCRTRPTASRARAAAGVLGADRRRRPGGGGRARTGPVRGGRPRRRVSGRGCGSMGGSTAFPSTGR